MPIRPLSIETVRGWCAHLPASPVQDEDYPASVWRVYGLAQYVLAYFLGMDWVSSHVHRPADAADYLRAGPTSGPGARPDDGGRHLLRVINLAELLLTVQHVPGFESPLKQLQSDSVEATIGELTAAMILIRNGTPVRFGTSVRQSNETFDLEVQLPSGARGCCEAKSKVESTALSDASIRQSIRDARAQLPSNAPGIVFLSVPQTWLDDPAFRVRLETGVADVLRNTGRIVSVIAYAWDVARGVDSLLISAFLMREIVNPASRFPDAIGTGLLRDDRADRPLFVVRLLEVCG